MLKEEFEKRIGGKVTEEDFRTIEYVYNWHPTIGTLNGKDQIADIYMLGGMVLINDMVDRSNRCEVIEGQIKACRRQIEELTKKIERLEASRTEY